MQYLIPRKTVTAYTLLVTYDNGTDGRDPMILTLSDLSLQKRN